MPSHYQTGHKDGRGLQSPRRGTPVANKTDSEPGKHCPGWASPARCSASLRQSSGRCKPVPCPDGRPASPAPRLAPTSAVLRGRSGAASGRPAGRELGTAHPAPTANDHDRRRQRGGGPWSARIAPEPASAGGGGAGPGAAGACALRRPRPAGDDVTSACGLRAPPRAALREPGERSAGGAWLAAASSLASAQPGLCPPAPRPPALCSRRRSPAGRGRRRAAPPRRAGVVLVPLAAPRARPGPAPHGLPARAGERGHGRGAGGDAAGLLAPEQLQGGQLEAEPAGHLPVLRVERHGGGPQAQGATPLARKAAGWAGLGASGDPLFAALLSKGAVGGLLGPAGGEEREGRAC